MVSHSDGHSQYTTDHGKVKVPSPGLGRGFVATMARGCALPVAPLAACSSGVLCWSCDGIV